MNEGVEITNLAASEGKKLTETKKSDSWGNTTDPREHNPQQFRYLVHMFNPFNEALHGPTALGEERSEQQAINLMEQPERISERVSLSMSLVDQDRMEVWGLGGLIVYAPESNIIITSPRDSAVKNSDLRGLSDRARELPRLSPEEVLNQTARGKYNEIVAQGEKEGSRLEVSGILLVKDIDGDTANDSNFVAKLREQAERLGLPLIEAPYYRGEIRKLDRQDGVIKAQFAGRVFNFGKEGAQRPFTVSTGVKEYFADESEVETVLEYFQGRGLILENEAKEIKDSYAEAKKRAMKPAIARDGMANYITFRTGVGKDYEIFNHRKGKISKVVVRGNVRNQQEIGIGEFLSALNTNKGKMEEREYREILQMVSNKTKKLQGSLAID